MKKKGKTYRHPEALSLIAHKIPAVLALAKFVGLISIGSVGCVSIVSLRCVSVASLEIASIISASIIALGLHGDVRDRTGSGRRCMGAVRDHRSRAGHRCVTGRPFGRLFDQETVSSAIGRDDV